MATPSAQPARRATPHETRFQRPHWAVRFRCAAPTDDAVAVVAFDGFVATAPADDFVATARLASHDPRSISSDAPTGSPAETVHRLRRLLDDYHGPHRGRTPARRLSTGWAALDEVLPGGGLPPGAVVELLTDPRTADGAGARTLAMRMALEAARHDASAIKWHSCDGPRDAGDSARPWLGHPAQAAWPGRPCHKTVVVVDGAGDFHPPAAAAMGLPLDRLLVVRPRNAADAFWAVHQALYCRAVGAVVATRLALDEIGSRRLQLAGEHGGGIALVLAPPATAHGHTFSTCRLLVEPVPLYDTYERSATAGVRHGHASVDHATRDATRHDPWHGHLAYESWPGRPGHSDGGVRRCRVTLLKVREGTPVEPVIVEWSDEAFDVPLHPVSAPRTAENRIPVPTCVGGGIGPSAGKRVSA